MAAVLIAALRKHQSVVRLKGHLSLGTIFCQYWLGKDPLASQVLKIACWNSEGWGSSLVQESRNELLEPQKGLAAAEARMAAELRQE